MTQRLSASTPTLRDGVEVFIYPQQEGNCRILFLFLANRRRLKITCKPSFVSLLRELAKDQPLKVSLQQSNLALDAQAESFLAFLEGEGIITLANPLTTNLLPVAYVERYKRQIYFLLDLLKQPHITLATQKRIYDAHIAILGLGAIGSSVLQQLCMMGFRQFTLVDCAHIEENDIARTSYSIVTQIDKPKTLAAKALVDDFAFDPVVRLHDTALTTQTPLEPLLQGTSFIVNTADEPYIGYTNIRLSRYALGHGIPMLAAGGFDAHLASLGELLIPKLTPCADCYASFFQKQLEDWKPITHPVTERSGWFGGLGSLSTFSAATAALEILSYFINSSVMLTAKTGRGEFLFHDYSLDNFTVERDIHCPTCGEDKQ